MKIFVTGTDTNIGKTFISSMLCDEYSLNYFKPIQTGKDDDKNFIKENVIIKKKKNIKIIDNIIRFKDELSPLACSIIENKPIDKNFLIQETQNIIKQNDNILIEGAGGLFTPISKDFFMIDFIEILNIPVVIVIEDKLGCINHAILTINEIVKRGIKIEKIMFNKVQSEAKYSNYAIISDFVKSLF